MASTPPPFPPPSPSPFPPEDAEPPGPPAVPVAVYALGVDHGAKAPVLILKECDGERMVPIWIGAAEASAIALHLGGIDVGRPMTHDLLAQAVRQLGGSVERILVSGLEGSTYLATVFVAHGGVRLELDARPSDAIALAIRTGARMEVAVTLLRLDGGGLAMEGFADAGQGMDFDVDLALSPPTPTPTSQPTSRPTSRPTSPPVPPQSLADYLRSLSPEDLGRYHP
jgi:uncharacterized protein